jgi:hypothetical protein
MSIFYLTREIAADEVSCNIFALIIKESMRVSVPCISSNCNS